jgi:sigma-B regulation protein RsbU (phosphoserine phosphatase)
MAVARTSINSLIRAHADEPGRCLSIANLEICGQNPLDLFVTVFLAVYDPGTGELRHANAGHNPPWIRRQGGGVEEVPSERDLALGVIDPIDYPTGRLMLAPGDQLVLYTDGVTEAFNGAGQMYGEARLLDLLREADRRSASELVREIFDDVSAFAAGHPQSDDITVAVLDIARG